MAAVAGVITGTVTFALDGADQEVTSTFAVPVQTTHVQDTADDANSYTMVLGVKPEDIRDAAADALDAAISTQLEITSPATLIDAHSATEDRTTTPENDQTTRGVGGIDL